MSPTVSSASEDPEAILEADSISMEDGTSEQNLEVSLLWHVQENRGIHIKSWIRKYLLNCLFLYYGKRIIVTLYMEKPGLKIALYKLGK